MSRKIKSVSFNLSDPMENEMYEYAMRHSNFSTFIKRLIQNSLNGHPDMAKSANKIQAFENVRMDKNSLRQLI